MKTFKNMLLVAATILTAATTAQATEGLAPAGPIGGTDLNQALLPPPGVYQRILREIEMPLIEIALDATAGNQAKCADLLGINRNTLRKKITDLDIRVTRRRKLM